MATSTEPARSRLAHGAAWLLGAGLLAVAIAGCGQEQIAAGHRELILKLATAASTRNQTMIDRSIAEIEAFKAKGELAEGEGRAFQAIIAAANDKDWDRAQNLAYALRDGQEPTEEDRERVAKRTMRDTKKPQHGGRVAPR